MSDAMLLLGGFIGLACILLAFVGGYQLGFKNGERAKQGDHDYLAKSIRATNRENK